MNKINGVSRSLLLWITNSRRISKKISKKNFQKKNYCRTLVSFNAGSASPGGLGNGSFDGVQQSNIFSPNATLPCPALLFSITLKKHQYTGASSSFNNSMTQTKGYKKKIIKKTKLRGEHDLTILLLRN